MKAEEMRELAPGFELPVTICVLFYGDHFPLCRRFFEHFMRHTPADAFQLRIGLNAVCRETGELAGEMVQRHANTTICDAAQNIYKLPMMRRLFTEPPLTSEWVIWFDDDSYPARSDWLSSLAVAVSANPGVSMWGSPRLMMPDPPLLAYVAAAPWFRHRTFLRHPESGEVVFKFVVGGYWAIRSGVLRQLDWPDQRLVHFEDDYLLGEALRQNAFEIGRCESGVVIDSGARRCPSGAPWVR